METFLEIKKKFNSFKEFYDWAEIQNFTELRQGSSGMCYCNLKIGNREVQHRIWNMYVPQRTKGITINPFREWANEDAFYCWESVFGTQKEIELLASKYDAKPMEASYTELQNDWILIFNTFEGCLQFMWDTAEQYDRYIKLWEQHHETKPLDELYQMSL